MRTILFSALLIFTGCWLTVAAITNDDKADKINGVWLSGSGKAKVKIAKDPKTGKYEGRIVWLRDPKDEVGKAKIDKNNPEESLKSRPLLGLKILREFDYKGDGLWENGMIYDPENGSDYNCTINLKDENTLEVRGFIGVSVFGRTDEWTRQIKK